MNIIQRELRANMKSLIIWSCSMLFLVYAGMVKYSGFAAAGQTANDLIQQMPSSMLKIMGMEGINLVDVSGYYSIFFLYFILLGAIHASMLGATIVSKEERDKTADFLLVKPIKRSRVLLSKIVVAWFQVLVLNIVTCVSSQIFVEMYNTGDPVTSKINNMMIALFIIQMLFLALGFLFSSLTHSTKKATGLATLSVLTMFMLSVAIDLYDPLKPLTFLTPFQYFDSQKVMNQGEFQLLYVLLSLCIMVVSYFSTYYLYQKRDLHT